MVKKCSFTTRGPASWTMIAMHLWIACARVPQGDGGDLTRVGSNPSENPTVGNGQQPHPGAGNIQYVCTTRFIESVRGTFFLILCVVVFFIMSSCMSLNLEKKNQLGEHTQITAVETDNGQCAQPRNLPHGQIPHSRLKENGQNPRCLSPPPPPPTFA